MTNMSHDISTNIDAAVRNILMLVDEKAQKCGVEYVVVGAAARDIIFHYMNGAEIERATEDYDFGVCVSEWQTFEALKQSFVRANWRGDHKEQHRLTSEEGYIVDLIPFGPIENSEGDILWPPDGGIVMNVMGFGEASRNAYKVKVADSPAVHIPVASQEGILLMKTIAWLNRAADIRHKDARDICSIFMNYQKIAGHRESLYETGVIEDFDHDIDLASVYMQGRNVRSIANKATLEYIEQGMNDRTKERLAMAMRDNHADGYGARRRLVDVFFDALLHDVR